MSKILFVYNDLNSGGNISKAMMVAERYARKANRGNFWVNSKPNPSIKFEDGSQVTVLPISKGVSSFSEYDEVFVDDSVLTQFDTNDHFSHKVKYYNENSF